MPRSRHKREVIIVCGIVGYVAHILGKKVTRIEKKEKNREKGRERGKNRFGPYDKMRKESVSEETNGKHVEVGFTPVIWAARQGGWEVNINICEG